VAPQEEVLSFVVVVGPKNIAFLLVTQSLSYPFWLRPKNFLPVKKYILSNNSANGWKFEN
jgi:hypothetical protein